MESLELQRSKSLNNIPQKKLEYFLRKIESSSDDPKSKYIKSIAINRYAESNIPIEYWTLKMESDFQGDPRLLAKYNEYIKDIKESYLNGTSICFAGNNGLGKTLTQCSILKKVVEKGYSALYSTLSDIVSVLTQSQNDEKFIARKELTLVDFLVIDEFDSRFFASENAADLYAKTLETIFRTRSQNKLPTLMSTNSPNIVESLHGGLKQSIESLFKGYITMFPVMGQDFRKRDR